MNRSRQEVIRELIKEIDSAAAYGKEKLKAAEQERPFTIVVCGAFSTGKTSLINVLLDSSLPTGINPVTKSVTILRYGETEKYILYSAETGEELVITHEKAEEMVLNKEKNPEYRRYQLIVELPAPFLKKGIILVDTPGFEDDEKEKLDELSIKAIKEADFCLVNFASNRFGTQSEREFLEELQSMTSGNFVSVLNCINYLMQEGQFEDLKKRADRILEDYGNEKIGCGRYFMVESKNKEDAWLDGLDVWMEEILKSKAKLIQKDTPLSLALWEIRKVSGKCNRMFSELLKEISRLMTTAEDQEQELTELQKAVDIISEKSTELQELLMSIRAKKYSI